MSEDRFAPAADEFVGRAARSPVVAVLVVVVIGVIGVGGGAGCQLLNLEPPRCQPPDDPFTACAPGTFCAEDGFCRDIPGVPIDDCAAPAGGAAANSAGVDVNISARGSDALPGVADAAILLSVRAEDMTPVVAGAQNGALPQPLGDLGDVDEGFTVLLDQSPLRAEPVPGLGDGPFVIETIFRTPTAVADDTEPIVSSSNALADGWLVATSGGFLVFVVGNRAVILTNADARVWHHLLCFVDIADLEDGSDDDDDVICAIDGESPVTLARIDNPLALRFDAPVFFGGGASTDAAVVSLRVWRTSAFSSRSGGTTSSRQDLLFDVARARLLGYLGIDAGTAKIALTNFGLSPRALELERGGVRTIELVAPGWPRLTREIGEDDRPEPGILVEPTRFDLLNGAPLIDPDAPFVTCAGGSDAAGPGGAPGGCAFVNKTVSLTVDVLQSPDDAALVAPDDPLTFSAFVDELATLDVTLAGQPICSYAAGVATGCIVDAGWADGFVRVIAAATTPAADFDVTLSISGTIWSAQLEDGLAVTSPFMFTVTTDQDGALLPFSLRFLEQLVLEQLALPIGAQTSLRAALTARALPATPVAIGEDIDLFRSLFIGLEEGDRSDLAVMEASVSELDLNTLQVDTIFARGAEASFVPGVPAVVGADIGAPLAGCADCFGGGGAVSTRVSSAVQWETLQLLGNGEAATVFGVELSTRGPAPLPTTLEMRAAAPANGCFEGLVPVAALVACGDDVDPINGGICSEGPDRVWRGRVSGLEPGPGIGELAASGSFVTDGLDTPLAELAFEVRYKHGGDGDVFQLLDDSGAAFVRVADEGNVIRLVAPGLDEESTAEIVAPGQWIQVSCWLGASSQCTINSSGLPSALGVVNVRGVVLDGMRVGAPAAAVAFARVWAVPEGLSENEVIRQHVTRTAATLGLPFAERRAPAFWAETRPTPTTLLRTLAPGDEPVAVRIGPGWPRVDLVEGVATYLADPAAGEGMVVLALDLTGRERGAFALELAEQSEGQVATLRSIFSDELLVLIDNGDDTTLFRARENNTESVIDQSATFPVSGAHLELSWRGVLHFIEDREGKALASSPLFPITSMQFLQVPGFFAGENAPGPATISMRSLRCGSR